MPTIMYVGGPADGRIEEVSQFLPMREVAVTPKPPVRWRESSSVTPGDACLQIERHVYQATEFHFTGGMKV